MYTGGRSASHGMASSVPMRRASDPMLQAASCTVPIRAARFGTAVAARGECRGRGRRRQGQANVPLRRENGGIPGVDRQNSPVRGGVADGGIPHSHGNVKHSIWFSVWCNPGAWHRPCAVGNRTRFQSLRMYFEQSKARFLASWQRAPKDGTLINIEFPNGDIAMAYWDKRGSDWRLTADDGSSHLLHHVRNDMPRDWWPEI